MRLDRKRIDSLFQSNCQTIRGILSRYERKGYWISMFQDSLRVSLRSLIVVARRRGELSDRELEYRFPRLRTSCVFEEVAGSLVSCSSISTCGDCTSLYRPGWLKFRYDAFAWMIYREYAARRTTLLFRAVRWFVVPGFVGANRLSHPL